MIRIAALRRNTAKIVPPTAISSLLSDMPTICQPHNLRRPSGQAPLPYGIRVSLPAGDPFRKIMGAQWHRVHWFATPAERDAELLDMSRKHEYSRIGDKPALVFEKVE